MKFVLNYSESTEKQKKKLKDELERSLEEFNTNLIFWGSSNIIKKYIQYKIGTKNPNGAIKNYEKFVYALRQDIGQDNKNLKEYDLIKLHLRADQFDEKGDLINT